MTLDDLIAPFTSDQQATVLSDWTWLTGDDKAPILLTASGNAFLQSAADGSVHELDTAEGWTKPLFGTVDELREKLTDRDFVAEHFHVQFVGELRAAGKLLQPGQVYSYKTPLVLGGSTDIENVEVCDLEVHFSVSGQIFRQVRDLPAGTQISGVESA